MYKPTFLKNSRLPLVVALAGLTCLSATTALADRQQAAAYYEDAVVLNNDGKHKEAVIQLKNALQQDAGLLPARVLLGTVYMETGDNRAAEKELLEAERLGVDRGLTAVPLARVYLKQHKYQQLIDELTLDNYPARVHGELLSLRGQAYMELLEFDAAQESFARAAQLIPDSPAPSSGMALLALRNGDIDTSVRQINQALAIAADDADALHIKATITHAQGDLAAAADAYGDVLIRHPDNLKARLARAGVYMDLRQFTDAAHDLEYLQEHYPLEPRAVYLQSLLHSYTGAAKKSKDALLKTASLIEALHPEFLSRSRQHLLLAGLTYHALGNFEQAGRHLKNLIQLTPNAPAPAKLLASALLELQQYADVIDLLQPLVDAGATDDYKLLTLLGNAYMLKGDHEKATAVLERAVTLNRGYADSHTSLALSYYNSGDLNQAVAKLSPAFADDARQLNAGAVLATLHLKQNHPAKALEVLNKVVAREPDNVTYLNLLGSAQAMLKDFAAARTSFEKLESLAPESVSAQIHLARLDALTGTPAVARQRLETTLAQEGIYKPKIMLELAKNEGVAGNMDEAVRWAEKARAEDADFMAAKHYLIDSYRRSGAYRKALDVALEAERVDNAGDLNMMATVAELYIALDEPGKARVWLKNMATEAGYDAQWLYRIARLQYEIDDYKAAEYSLRKAVQEQPAFTDAQIALIEILTGLNKLDEAEKRIHSLASTPEFNDGDRLLGDIAARRGDTPKAVRHYRRAMAAAPSTLLTVKLYQAHAGAGDWRQATRVVTDWLKQHPEDIQVREALAEAYLQQNQLRDAQREYETILTRQPDAPRLLSNLAYIYSQTGNNQALDTARKAYDLAPHDAAVNDTLGWILVQRDKAQKGLLYLREAHSRQSSDPEIRYHIAAALQQLGRNDEARAELRQALAAGRPFNGIEAARELQQRLANATR